MLQLLSTFQPLSQLQSEEDVGEFGESVDVHPSQVAEGEKISLEGHVLPGNPNNRPMMVNINLNGGSRWL